jgi:hypothetical protein
MAIQIGVAPFPPVSGAFGDRRLFLCRPGDPMLIGWWTDDQCGHEQAEDGPICLVIGRRASSADLDRLQSRFGVPMESLIEFRSRAQGSRAALRREAREALKARGIERFAVLYVKDGQEHRSPWFSSRERAQAARAVLKAKHGAAVVYAD